MIPNLQPTLNAGYRIAFIADHPSADDAQRNEPLVGHGGRLLSQLAGKAGLSLDACFKGHICQEVPPYSDFTSFPWSDDPIREGLATLKRDLDSFKPAVIVCLGNAALSAFKHPYATPVKKKVTGAMQYVFPSSVDSERGTPFYAKEGSPAPGFLCLSTFHPTSCFRQFDLVPVLNFDIRKAGRYARKGYTPIKRTLHTQITKEEIRTYVDNLLKRRPLIALDIEGTLYGMPCISISDRTDFAFIIPFYHLDGSSYWSVEDEMEVWRMLTSILTNDTIPKIWQNGLYDRFVLQYGFKIPVLGNHDDTMLLWWERFCELEKGLGFQASVATDEPYYKADRKSGNTTTFYEYCCKDSVLTFEIHEKALATLRPSSLKHYRFNNTLLSALLYSELRGIRYDLKEAAQCLTITDSHINSLQYKLDTMAGVGFGAGIDFMDRCDILAKVQEHLCMKRNPLQPKKPNVEAYTILHARLSDPTPLSHADIGHLNILCGVSMNVRSPQFKSYLYETLKLPRQTNTKTGAATTDYTSLLKIQKRLTTKGLPPSPAVELALDLTMLRTRSQMLAIKADPDGRVRCGYNLVGTETGRMSSYTSPTGSGYNLQTIPSDNFLKPEGHPLRQGMRHIFTADPGCWMFQCDLSGADGWTIGAHLAILGDDTMLRDLRARIKPAQRIAYMLRYGNDALNGKSREEIRVILKDGISKEDWIYIACKMGIWGICYLMGPDRLSDVILTQSEGLIAMPRKEIERFRNAVFSCYNVRLLHQHMQRELNKNAEITAASGHIRRFYGRQGDILGNALSHEPQANTTYATNLALYNLWTDPENRIGPPRNGVSRRGPLNSTHPEALRIEPLHQVHDAILGQFRKEDTDWAISKIKSYFANTITIAGLEITIPFEGNYGTSWGSLEAGVI